jgi:uncharacterized membrane protein HdeD (DUF308 family)
MNSALTSTTDPLAATELNRLSRHWLMFALAGAVMVGLGTFAIGWACLTTLTLVSVWIFGCFLIAGGITEVLSAFWAGRWSGRLLHLLVGVMYLLIGVMFINEPKDSAIRLTLIIAIFLIVGGALRIVHSLSEPGPARSAIFLSGTVSLLLGLSIYRQWPVSGLWVIGLFIGIEMLLSGWAWIMLALTLRRAGHAAQLA